MKSYSLRLSCTAVLLSVLLLTGCGKKSDSSASVQQAAPTPTPAAAEITPTPAPTPVPTPTPTPTPTYDLNFSIGEQQISASMTSLDLSQATAEEVDRLISVLPALTSLNTLELGTADGENPVISWEQVRALEEGLPQATLNYTFSIRGYLFHLSDQILNLNHLVFEDEGALAEQIASCMPNLKVLDMDSCGVSNESMAAIRDRFPGVNVVWRVWIGADYSTRTDVERLMISNPDRGGDLNTPESIEGLFYCNKVKYLVQEPELPGVSDFRRRRSHPALRAHQSEGSEHLLQFCPAGYPTDHEPGARPPVHRLPLSGAVRADRPV